MFLGNGALHCDERRQMSGEEDDRGACPSKNRLIHRIVKGRLASEDLIPTLPICQLYKSGFSPRCCVAGFLRPRPLSRAAFPTPSL